MSAWSCSFDFISSLLSCSLTSSHTGLLCFLNYPNSFLLGAFDMAVFSAWLPWYAGPSHGSGHGSNVLLRKIFANHPTKCSMFFPYPITIPSPCLSAWNYLSISSLIYNSENELYGRRDLLSLVHCLKLRTSIVPINACSGDELNH